MSASIQIQKRERLFSIPISSLFKENNFTQKKEFPKSANVFICLFLERLEKLVSLAETMETDPKENTGLASLMEYVMKLLELPGSAAEMADLNRQINRIIGENNFRIKHKADFEQLTQREKEVLSLLAIGYSNKDVANQLYISLETAKHHRKIIKSKLNIGSTTELVQFGQAFNLI